MLLWILFAVLMLFALGMVLWPLAKSATPSAERAEYDVEVYRQQLQEIEQDRARGVFR